MSKNSVAVLQPISFENNNNKYKPLTKLDADDVHMMNEIEQLHQQSTLDLLQHAGKKPTESKKEKFVMPSVLDELDDDDF